MGSVDSAKKLTQTVQNSKYTTTDNKEINRIHVSTLCPNSSKEFDSDSYAYKLAQLSGGIAVSNYNTAPETEVQDITSETVNVLASKAKSSKTSVSVSTNLIQILGEGNNGTYKIISSTGLTTIKLEQPLTEGSKEDYDKDGLSDWKEVNTTLIYNMYVKHNHSYTPVIKSSYLPTLADCKDYYTNLDDQKAYVEEGYNAILKKFGEEKINTYHILPINSDPTKIDSDGDGILDSIKYYNSEEYNRYGLDANKYKKTEFSDPNPLKYEYLWEWPLLNTAGNKVSQIASGFYETRKHQEKDKVTYDNHAAIDIATSGKSGFTVVAAYDGILKSIRTSGSGGCTITLLHRINGKDFTSTYMHMAYYDNYDGYDNSNHEFIQYINKILEKRGKGETFKNTVWGQSDVHDLNIYVKSGTPIGIASGTSSEGSRKAYGIHLHFGVQEVATNSYINPITFMKSLDSTKTTKSEYKCEMLINVPKDLHNTCSNDEDAILGYECDCKNELEGGEAYEIREKYKIEYNITYPNPKK